MWEKKEEKINLHGCMDFGKVHCLKKKSSHYQFEELPSFFFFESDLFILILANPLE